MMLVGLLVLVLGVVIGSFLNVVILRTEAGSSLGGRSKCVKCAATLRPIDLIPVVSFLMLRGKCHSCHARISVQYPLVESATGLLFLACFFAFPTIPGLVRGLVLVPFLVVIFVYDLRYQLILDRFSIPAMFAAFALSVWAGYAPRDLLYGALAIGGFFLAQHLVSKGRWIGAGDIRMGALMGLILGLRDGLGALFVAYVLGALVGVYLIATKRATGKTKVPFGTFLVAGTLVMLFVGRQLMDWYLGFFVV
jgi:prepilin signal peptidase PulO-like enzyme (type II secretory pathway)